MEGREKGRENLKMPPAVWGAQCRVLSHNPEMEIGRQTLKELSHPGAPGY